VIDWKIWFFSWYACCKSSAKKALENDQKYLDGIKELMSKVDDYIVNPDRLLNAPFILPVETVLVAQGRGTVVTVK